MSSRLSRDLDGARDAFAEADAEASRVAHQRPKEQHAGQQGEFIQSIVFGGLDGIITTFAIVIAAAAAHQTYGTVLVIGFANLLADAIGMGVGDFLSSRAEEDHEQAEKVRESAEIEAVPEREKQEMIDIYVKKGLSLAEAQEVVTLLFPHREAFLNIMMIEELGIMSPPGDGDADDDPHAALKGAVVTFGSFMLCGGIPLLPFLLSFRYAQKVDSVADPIIIVSVALFAIALFGLGSWKGVITGTRWYLTGGTMLINGTVTTLLAYGLGVGLESVLKR